MGWGGARANSGAPPKRARLERARRHLCVLERAVEAKAAREAAAEGSVAPLDVDAWLADVLSRFAPAELALMCLAAIKEHAELDARHGGLEGEGGPDRPGHALLRALSAGHDVPQRSLIEHEAGSEPAAAGPREERASDSESEAVLDLPMAEPVGRGQAQGLLLSPLSGAPVGQALPPSPYPPPRPPLPYYPVAPENLGKIKAEDAPETCLLKAG